MSITFGSEICADLAAATGREWLVTNGTGSYAALTVAGILTRGYHGLLVAALEPPLGRTVLLAKLEETCAYQGIPYLLSTNRWADGTLAPQGHRYLQDFYLQGTLPVWQFGCADALLEKRVWMIPGQTTTCVRYTLLRASAPVALSLKALVNYRDYHGRTRGANWQPDLTEVVGGLRVTALPGARPFYLLCDEAQTHRAGQWYRGFALSAEQERGLDYLDDHYHAVTFEAVLEVGQSLTCTASLEPQPECSLIGAHQHTVQVLADFRAVQPAAPPWIEQLVLAADQFIVARPPGDGQTIIAGYPWFGDWGRDTMIALPGLTLSTGRPTIARSILRTFAQYISRGMLPNRFPEDGQPLTDADYNTVDATLWYVEAVRQYVATTGDLTLLTELFGPLAQIVEWHQLGTRFGIGVDPRDGLLQAGTAGVQLTWMDAKVGDWVVTPRMGKPVEINALWYNALRTMVDFGTYLGQPTETYEAQAARVLAGFERFWNGQRGHCYDVIDGPAGADPALRPNQLFAISLPHSPLSAERQRQVVEVCGQQLLATCGLRSLAPSDPAYIGQFSGGPRSRDGAYHQGTVWGWLLGPFVLAHLRVHGDRAQAASFLAPVVHHLMDAGLGTISEVFEGDPPFLPKGCFAQAWSVAEVLRAWCALNPRP